MPKNAPKDYEFFKALLEGERKADIESLPCTIFEQDGVFGFRFSYIDKPGIVALEFYPQGFAAWALNRSKAIMRAVAADKLASQPNRDSLLKEYPSDEQALVIAPVIATVFIKGLSGKMRSLLGELEAETECFMYEAAHKILPGDGGPQFNSVEQLAKEMAGERKRFLKKLIARFGEPQWNEMRAHYDELLPIAKKAKRLYEQNKKEKNWKDMIKGGYPQLDDDLITLLSNDDDDLATLPVHVLKATENSEDYSKASNVALEQAARRCKMKPFQYTPRTLRDRMDEQRPVKSATKRISPKTPKARKRSRRKDSPKKLVSAK